MIQLGIFKTRKELESFVMQSIAEGVRHRVIAEQADISVATVRRIVACRGKGERVLASKDVRGAIKVCLTCTLPTCTPSAKDCPYHQKYKGLFSMGQQKTCGFEEQPIDMNVGDLNKACDRVINEMGIKRFRDEFTEGAH